jgi:hypothetical protein
LNWQVTFALEKYFSFISASYCKGFINFYDDDVEESWHSNPTEEDGNPESSMGLIEPKQRVQKKKIYPKLMMMKNLDIDLRYYV